MGKIFKHLWAKILFGMVLGVIVGVILGPDFAPFSAETTATISSWLALPGNLFLTFIKFIIIPIVISSVILGIAGGDDIAKIKKIGGAIVIYFIFTSAVAATISIFFTTLIAPGAGGGGDLGVLELTSALPTAQSLGDNIPASIINILPTNPIQSMAEGKLLEIVIASVIFGVALLVMKKSKSEAMLKVLDSIQGASLVIIDFIMKFAPIAVFGLISKVVIESGFGVMFDLGLYIGTFLLILATILVFYSLVLKFYVGLNPLDFAGKIREPFIIAFSTSSSSATMPVTLRTAEKKLKVHPTVGRLVVPVGATVNLDGTAAYQSVVIIFLAQFFGIDLSMFQIVSLVTISVLASIGAPGVPGGSLAILVGILASFGIPNEGFALILAVDRILDMCRTAVNVTGDLVTCTVMQKFSRSKPAP